MPQDGSDSLGSEFALRVNRASRAMRLAPREGARDLPRLIGLTPKCVATVPIENLYATTTEMLTNCGGVYLYGENVVTEVGSGNALALQLLTVGCELMSTTAALMANIFTCQTAGESPIFFAPPRGFVAPLLARGPTRTALPRIVTYARRPVYDRNFVLRGPGYHAEQSILVHGLSIDPVLPCDIDEESPIRDRMPPHIGLLFSGFCFRDAADVANGLATLLTGALSNHFVFQPKASINVDANQVGTGKSLFATVVGAVLDGELPELVHFTADNEELAKRVLAVLRQHPTAVLIIDNAKNHGGMEISSPVIEANSMAPNISLRILGTSTNYSQPNDVLWFITMNQTKISPDLASRSMPIRLYHEGDPAQREFDGPNPLDYALDHRGEILSELFGFVERWKAYGRPLGCHGHRCKHWAQIIGGILEVNGFPEFLDNAAEAAADFNTELGDLAALAERVIRNGPAAAYLVVTPQPTGG